MFNVVCTRRLTPRFEQVSSSVVPLTSSTTVTLPLPGAWPVPKDVKNTTGGKKKKLDSVQFATLFLTFKIPRPLSTRRSFSRSEILSGNPWSDVSSLPCLRCDRAYGRVQPCTNTRVASMCRRSSLGFKVRGILAAQTQSVCLLGFVSSAQRITPIRPDNTRVIRHTPTHPAVGVVD